jgi:uncharacterized protein YbaP (TraB family)
MLSVAGNLAAEPCCEQGLLFRLQSEAGGAEPCWLFATIHTDDPRVTRLPVPVREAFDQARTIVLELVPDSEMLEASRSMMLLAPQTGLSELIPASLYQDLVGLLSTRGMTPAAIERLRPWAVLLVLSMPPSSGQPVLDLVLYQRALSAGKTVQGLETIAEQLGVFEALSLEDQIGLLEATVRETEQLPGLFTALVDAYLAEDLGELMRLGQTLAADDPELDARLRKRLFEDRNRRMFERMQRFLQQGACFVAVGALHLPGDNGLLQQLERAGFEVQRID